MGATSGAGNAYPSGAHAPRVFIGVCFVRRFISV